MRVRTRSQGNSDADADIAAAMRAFATPSRAPAVLDEALAEYRLFIPNAQDGPPDRGGVEPETPVRQRQPTLSWTTQCLR